MHGATIRFISLYTDPVTNWKYRDTKDLNVPASFEHLCRTHITIVRSGGKRISLSGAKMSTSL